MKIESEKLETILDELKAHIPSVDFLAEAYPETIELRKKIETSGCANEIKKLKEELKKFTLNEKQKYVIIVEILIKVAKENNYGLCKNKAFCYLYNGNYWVEVKRDLFESFLGEIAEKMGLPRVDAMQYGVKDQLFKQFLATGFLPTPEGNNEIKINLQNGTFYSKGRERGLKEFNPEDFLRYILPFEYNPDATCPIFNKFLDRVLPEKNSQYILAEFIGWLFLTGFKQEKALILYGSGANGKSVIFDIISALLSSENISSYSMNDLCNDNGYYRAMLVNKLLNYSSEIGGNKTNPDTIKKLISNEPISCRLPYGEPFILDSEYAKLMFNANTLPKDTEQTNAYFRRFIIIPFTETIPEAEQDKYLAQRIINSELSGIFNWVLRGLDRLIENQKFTESDAAKQAIEKYRIESDTVQMFLSEEGYIKSEKHTIMQKELFTNYRIYCADNCYKPVGNRTFGDRCKAIGYISKRISSGMCLGAEKKAYLN